MGKGLGQSAEWGRVVWGGLAESQSQRPFRGSSAGLLMGQLQPFMQPFTLKCNNRKGGGDGCREMGLCACAGGM